METEDLKTTFTDTKGREWSLRLSTARAMRLRESGVDIATLFVSESELVNELLADPWKLVDLLLLVLKDQLEERSIARDDFLDSIDGNKIDEATIAFLNGAAMALPKLQRRGLLAAIQKISTGIEVGATKIEARVEAINLEKIFESVSGS